MPTDVTPQSELDPPAGNSARDGVTVSRESNPPHPAAAAMLSAAGIILCGGRSSRMGQSKAWLRIGPETFLQRIVRTMQPVLRPIIIVAAVDQPLPELPAEIEIVRDEQPDLGPLASMAIGLQAVAARHPEAIAYVSSTDVPLLRPEFIRAVLSQLGTADIAIPTEGRFAHPLAACYRVGIAPILHELLHAGQRRPAALLDRVATQRIDIDWLRTVDPELDSLCNANTPEEYSALLARVGQTMVDPP